MISDLVKKNRSYRRFDQSINIDDAVLNELVDICRYTPSARNIQPLKYAIINDKKSNEKLFKSLAWAGYLKDWAGPDEGEKPSAYIVMFGDKDITTTYSIDPGIAAQTLLLAAVEKDLGGCILMNVNKKQVALDFSIPDNLELIQVIALGKPIEEVVITDMQNDDYKYYRNADDVHFVPKRAFADIVVKI